MKDIHSILSGIGFTVPEDKKADFDKALRENYKTIDEVGKIETARDTYKGQLDDVTSQLKTFEGVDVDDLKGQIATLNKTIETNNQTHQAEMAHRDFMDKIVNEARARKAKNVKAVIAQLDIDALEKSKNQSADIKSALDAVEKSDEYLFDNGKTPPAVYIPGNPAPIGSDAKSYMDDFYKNNPFYHN